MLLNSLNNPWGGRMLPHGIDAAEWEKVPEELQSELLGALAQREWPILMFGPTGRGKTCAMACVFMALPAQFMAMWYDTGELLQRMMECRKSNTGNITRYTQDGKAVTESEFDIKRKLNSADYVFLDDVGVTEPTEAKRGAFEEIINIRQGKPTIYSSNKTARELADIFDMRVVSRLFSGVFINVESGVDRRIHGKQVRKA